MGRFFLSDETLETKWIRSSAVGTFSYVILYALLYLLHAVVINNLNKQKLYGKRKNTIEKMC
jgi:hypothetical protein